MEGKASMRKGNCRTPRRSNKRRESTLAIVDRLMMSPVQTTLDGNAIRITVLEAIMYQLLQKQMAGNGRAGRVLLKYEGLSKHAGGRRPELEFVESEYTRL